MENDESENILTGTFFWVATTVVSTPFRATEVSPPWLIALNAYSATNKTRFIQRAQHATLWTAKSLRSRENPECFSGIQLSKLRIKFTQTARSVRSINLQNLPTWYSRPSGENIVMCLSNPALLPLAMFLVLDHGYKLRSTDYTTYLVRL